VNAEVVVVLCVVLVELEVVVVCYAGCGSRYTRSRGCRRWWVRGTSG